MLLIKLNKFTTVAGVDIFRDAESHDKVKLLSKVLILSSFSSIGAISVQHNCHKSSIVEAK